MRKDELLHLHQLLGLVRSELEHRGEVSPDAFAAYRELGVGPMTIYASKSEHERAVKLLAGTLASAAESPSDHGQPVPPQ